MSLLKGSSIAMLSHLDRPLHRFRLPLMKRLVSLGAHVQAIAPEGKVAKRFGDHGVEFIHFPIDRMTFNPLTALSAVGDLACLLKSISPDLLQTFSLRPNAYGALAARRAQIPVTISTVTGLGSLYADESSVRMALMRIGVDWTTRLALRSVSAVVFQNPDDRDYYINHRLCQVDQARLILSSGVDLEEFSPDRIPQARKDELRWQWRLGSSLPVVTMIARLVYPKGVVEFLEAAEMLKGNAHFVLIGDIDYTNPAAIDSESVRTRVERSVVVTPGRQENVEEWLSISDIFVLPSYYREGVPRTVLEAMAMGLPIVTTDAPGCRETVIEGFNGLLVTPRDVKSLSQALARLIQSPNMRKCMGQRSRSLAEERFSSDVVVDQYVSLYSTLLGGEIGSPEE